MLDRRTPLRSDPAKAAEWRRRSKPINASRSTLRNKPFKPTGAKPRGTPIKQTSTKQRKRMADRRVAVPAAGPREAVAKGPDHAFREYVTQLCCAVQLGPYPNINRVDPAHLQCKRVNGDWVTDPNTGGRRGNIMPLCRAEHEAQHAMGVDSFAEARRLDLELICERVGEAYLAGWTSFALSYSARKAGGYQHLDLDNPPIDPSTEAP